MASSQRSSLSDEYQSVFKQIEGLQAEDYVDADRFESFLRQIANDIRDECGVFGAGCHLDK